MSHYSFGIAYEDENGDCCLIEVNGPEQERRLQQLYRLRRRAEHFDLNELSDILSKHIEQLCAGEFDDELFVVDEEIRHAESEITKAEIKYDNKRQLKVAHENSKKSRAWTYDDKVYSAANWVRFVYSKPTNWPAVGDKRLKNPLMGATARPRLSHPGIKDQTKAKQIVCEGLSLITDNMESEKIREILDNVFDGRVPDEISQIIIRASHILN